MINKRPWELNPASNPTSVIAIFVFLQNKVTCEEIAYPQIIPHKVYTSAHHGANYITISLLLLFWVRKLPFLREGARDSRVLLRVSSTLASPRDKRPSGFTPEHLLNTRHQHRTLFVCFLALFKTNQGKTLFQNHENVLISKNSY